MSWQAYVDTSLVQSGNIDKGAIFSKAGDSVWAVTPGYAIKPEEMAVIAGSFNDSKSLFATGFHIADEKFICIKQDTDSIYGKKGKAGVILVKTGQAIVVGHHPESVTTQTAGTTTESLGDHLKKAGY